MPPSFADLGVPSDLVVAQERRRGRRGRRDRRMREAYGRAFVRGVTEYGAQKENRSESVTTHRAPGLHHLSWFWTATGRTRRQTRSVQASSASVLSQRFA